VNAQERGLTWESCPCASPAAFTGKRASHEQSNTTGSLPFRGGWLVATTHIFRHIFQRQATTTDHKRPVVRIADLIVAQRLPQLATSVRNSVVRISGLGVQVPHGALFLQPLIRHSRVGAVCCPVSNQSIETPEHIAQASRTGPVKIAAAVAR